MKRIPVFQSRRTGRRQFLKEAASAATAFGVPCVVPGSVFGRNPPSTRINIGLIGCGNQSTVDLPAFLQQDDVQVLAVCDVNRGSHGYLTPEQFLGREPVRDTVNKYYAGKSTSGQFQGCEAYNDFREVLARKDIDAVVVVVPDHWHGLITVMAAEAGKDIYCEKPLSLCIAQGQKMIAAVRKHKRVLQTGSQFRSSPDNRFACELVRNGRIGKVERVLTFIAQQNAVDPGPGWQPMPVPDGFDYDFWLGPAPKAPYHEGRCLYRFRFNLDYSGGQTTNFGAHSNDIAQWGLGMDDSGPVEFEDLGSQWPPKGSLYTTATKVHFRARYANGVELICETRDPRMGARFEGTEGWVQFGFGGLKTEPESLKTTVIGPNEVHLPRSNPAREKDVYGSYIPDHVRNFLDAVKSRTDPIGPVEIGHRTASLCHLGNIAMLLKRKLQWDPQAERFANDDEANRMLDRPMRAPWQL
jgi:predicted dehydrogenase